MRAAYPLIIASRNGLARSEHQHISWSNVHFSYTVESRYNAILGVHGNQIALLMTRVIREVIIAGGAAPIAVQILPSLSPTHIYGFHMLPRSYIHSLYIILNMIIILILWFIQLHDILNVSVVFFRCISSLQIDTERRRK